MKYDRNNAPSGFYVYCYLRKDLSPYYVGKGKDGRAWAKHHTIKNGHFSGVPVPADEIRIVIVEANLTEVGAFSIERRLIRWYGRKDNNTGILRNRTDGGEGGSGIVVTEESRKKRSIANKGQGKGRKLPKETVLKMRAAANARTAEVKEATKKKMSDSHKGKVISEETKIKISGAKKNRPNLKNLGRKASSEEIAKKTESRKNNGKPWFSPETRAKISNAVREAAKRRRLDK
jgi:hypothetical protein